MREFQESRQRFDGRENYTSLKSRRLPEIEYDQIDKVRVSRFCIVTSAGTDEEGKPP